MIKFELSTKRMCGIAIYMMVDNDPSTTHLIFNGGVTETVEKLRQLKKAIPFAIFKWEDGEEIDVKEDD